MMALGKPIVSFIRDDLRRYYHPSLPIISASFRNLVEVLREVVTCRERWKALGEGGRQYVERVHEVHQVATVALQAYRG